MMSHSFQKESDELSVSCDKLYSKLTLLALFQSVTLIILTVGLTGMYAKFSHSNYFMAAFFIMLFIIQCISDPLTKSATDVFSALGTTYHNLTSKAEYCNKLVSRVRSFIFLFVSAEVFVFVLFLLFSHFKIALICLLILSAFAVDGKTGEMLIESGSVDFLSILFILFLTVIVVFHLMCFAYLFIVRAKLNEFKKLFAGI